MSGKKITVIGVPMWYGAAGPGPERSPKVLREAGFIDNLAKPGFIIEDLGDLAIPAVDESKMFDESGVRYLDAIIEVNLELAAKAFAAYRSGSLLITLGGDHSIALGMLAALGTAFKNPGALWLDAHGDFNLPSTSRDGTVHGMGLGAGLGFGSSKLTDFYRPGVKVKTSNVVWFGSRSLTQGEKTLAEAHNLNLYGPDKMREIGLEAVAEQTLAYLKAQGIDSAHISFDTDFLGSDTADPATGIPEPNGFNWEELATLTKPLFNSGLVKSFDVAEFWPSHDKNGATAKGFAGFATFMGENWK